jgi:hypothetical protein
MKTHHFLMSVLSDQIQQSVHKALKTDLMIQMHWKKDLLVTVVTTLLHLFINRKFIISFFLSKTIELGSDIP